MVKGEEEGKALPPPKRGDHHSNLETRQVRVTDGRAKKQKKGLQQFAVKAKARVLDRFEELLAKMKAANPNFTKGDLLELIVASFEKNPAEPANLRLAATPDAQDRADGRTVHLDVFATPDLAKVLTGRAKEKRWSVGATIEHACADAKDYTALVGAKCKHCGRPAHR